MQHRYLLAEKLVYLLETVVGHNLQCSSRYCDSKSQQAQTQAKSRHSAPECRAVLQPSMCSTKLLLQRNTHAEAGQMKQSARLTHKHCSISSMCKHMLSVST